MIAVRDGIPYEQITMSPLPPADSTTDWVGVILHLTPSTKLRILNLYVPPIRTGTNDAREQHFSPIILPMNHRTMVVGDFNGHHQLWDDHCDRPDPIGEQLSDWFLQRNCTTFNTGAPTHLHRGTGGQSAPDVTICHRELAKITNWAIDEDLGSDHLPISITVRLNRTPSELPRKQTKSWKKADWELFRNTSETKFEEWLLRPPSTPEEAFQSFTSIISEADNTAIPSGRVKAPVPWWNEEIDRAVQERKAARRQAHLGPEKRSTWNQKNREAKRIRKEGKQTCWREYASTLSARSDPRKVSLTLKAMEGKLSSGNQGAALRVGNRVVTTDRDKANEYIKEYASVSRLPQDKRDREKGAEVKDAIRQPCSACEGQRTGFCGLFTLKDLDRALRKIQCGKSPGDDQITNDHLKHLGPHGRKSLLHIINVSWKQGRLPKDWKRATIIPIKKAGKPDGQIGSFRPISLTSCVGKVAERLIQERLYWMLEHNRKLHPAQAGFRRKRSTSDQIARLQQLIHDGFQQSPAQKSIVILFDMRRAFDTVWHNGLLQKLKETGVGKCPLKWIKNFLSDRIAKVRYNNSDSRFRIFRAGVPQGSVLAPLLFDIFVNDIPDELQEDQVTPFLFADDLAVVIQGPSVEECERKANLVTEGIERWAREWRMQLAPEKTEASLFSTTSGDANRVLNINLLGQRVNTSRNPTFLGITLDRLFSYTTHTKKVRQKAAAVLRQLITLAGTDYGSDMEDLKLLEKTYIRSKLLYAAEAWLPAACSTAQNTIDVARRSAARWITGATRNTNSDVLAVETDLMPAAYQAKSLAGKLYERALRLPDHHPIRHTAQGDCHRNGRTGEPRLKSVTSWREVGAVIVREAGLHDLPREQIIVTPSDPPWRPIPESVTFNRTNDTLISRDSAPDIRRTAAEETLDRLPPVAVTAWTDGSVLSGTDNGGAGVLIEFANGDPRVECQLPRAVFAHPTTQNS